MRMTAWVGALPRDARDTLFLLGVIGIVLLPQVPELPWWCILLTTIVLVWRGTLAVQSKPLPSRWWLVVCVLAVVLGLFTIFLSTAAGTTPVPGHPPRMRAR